MSLSVSGKLWKIWYPPHIPVICISLLLLLEIQEYSPLPPHISSCPYTPCSPMWYLLLLSLSLSQSHTRQLPPHTLLKLHSSPIQTDWVWNLALETFSMKVLQERKHMFSEYLTPNLIILAQKKYREMVQLLSTGPYSFCGVWRVFVSSQFQTRYCGHTLSRLMEIRHNKTKQSRFPTIRRVSLKSWTTWTTIQVIPA